MRIKNDLGMNYSLFAQENFPLFQELAKLGYEVQGTHIMIGGKEFFSVTTGFRDKGTWYLPEGMKKEDLDDMEYEMVYQYYQEGKDLGWFHGIDYYCDGQEYEETSKEMIDEIFEKISQKFPDQEFFVQFTDFECRERGPEGAKSEYFGYSAILKNGKFTEEQALKGEYDEKAVDQITTWWREHLKPGHEVEERDLE